MWDWIKAGFLGMVALMCIGVGMVMAAIIIPIATILIVFIILVVIIWACIQADREAKAVERNQKEKRPLN